MVYKFVENFELSVEFKLVDFIIVGENHETSNFRPFLLLGSDETPNYLLVFIPIAPQFLASGTSNKSEALSVSFPRV